MPGLVPGIHGNWHSISPRHVDGRVKPTAVWFTTSVQSKRVGTNLGTPPAVMAGLDPAIHAFATYWIGAPEGVDHRVKPDDDDFQLRQTVTPHAISHNRTAVGQARP
jgi:hypothetical protein